LFCNPEAGGSAELNIPAELPEIEVSEVFERGFPESPLVISCNDPDLRMSTEDRQGVCEDAAIYEARALPDASGNPSTECTYLSPRDGVEHTCDECLDESGIVCDEFIQRSAAAPGACGPGGPAGDVSTWTYQRRDFNWRINLVPVPLLAEGPDEPLVIPDEEDRLYTIELTTEVPQHRDSLADKVDRAPCGPGGSIASGYNSTARFNVAGVYAPSQMLCVQDHLEPDTDAWVPEAGPGTEGLPLREWRDRFDGPRWTEQTEPYEAARPADVDPDVPWPPTWLQPPYVPEDRPYFVGAWTGATFLHGCTSTVEDLAELDLPEYDTETEQPAGDTNSCGQGSMINHAMERGPELGSETFQLRAVVVGGTQRQAAREIVERMPFRRTGQSRGASTVFTEAGDLASHVFVAQAEYYFDTTWDEGRGEVHADPEEWMWSMSWRARLRRFRLPVDEDESERGVGADASGCGFDAPEVDVTSACAAAGESCPSGFLDQLRELAESVMVH
jgi:hypothetical protein